MYFCLQVGVCISGRGGGGVGGGRGSLISSSLQYFVISDVWDVCFPDFISLGYL